MLQTNQLQAARAAEWDAYRAWKRADDANKAARERANERTRGGFPSYLVKAGLRLREATLAHQEAQRALLELVRAQVA